MADFHLLAAQRHAKVAGIFVRLVTAMAKTVTLPIFPRVLRMMEAAMVAAGLTEIRDLLESQLPGWQQGGAALLPRGKPDDL